MNTLKVYKSSAGSGKTFILVLEYLKLVLAHPDDYKAILAITFTNKAADEMKHRIIDALVSLSSGEDTAVRKILSEQFSDSDLTKKSERALKNILHDYSSFSVSTIDSFFQKILRALAREINLPLNMEVEVEMDDAILEVTDKLLKEIGIDKELTQWLTDLAIQKIDDEKGWNLEKDIASVARELFKEKRHNSKTLSREEIQKHYKRLLLIRQHFENKMKDSGNKALAIIQKNNLEISDFSHGSKGVAGYFLKIINGKDSEDYKIKGRVADAMQSSEKWATKKSDRRNEILTVASEELIPLLLNINSYVEIEFRNYQSAVEVIRKIYLFGLVNDLQKKFSEYREDNNVILLSDTTRLLNNVIHDQDAPFLYEKTGNRYKHLLIDEFQDTSQLQWKNLLPLIINTLGSGFTTLIVGDAKQSIYRWRGGNMNLLLTGIFNDLNNFKSLIKEEVLSVNYRSKKSVIEFNNSFFKNAPELVNEQLGMNNYPPLQLAYNEDLKQKIDTRNEIGGFVRMRFLTASEKDNGKDGWKDPAFTELLSTIKKLLENNYSYKDICILVRKNSDGNDIANMLFENGIEEIISPDSLLITSSPKISFILDVFRFLLDNSNAIAKSEIIYYYRRYLTDNKNENWHEVFSDHKKAGFKSKNNFEKNKGTLFEGLEGNLFNRILPESFTSQISSFSKLPVYELTEQLMSIFNLNSSPDSYMQRFQDLVLEYSSKSNSSLDGFLNWWENSKSVSNASVIIPENTDAIKIMTIHRSKGLQFPIVLMPFTDWRLLPKPNELMWMDTKDSPLEELGMVVVSSSDKLRDTYFQKEYEEEVNQTIIDNINMLYVAFTRAEEKLFVWCPADNKNELNSISKLIFRTCQSIDIDFSDTFDIGMDEPRKQEDLRKKKHMDTQYLKTYPSTLWQDKLSLASHSGDLLSIFNDKKMSKINYGILVHSVLAEIHKISEVDSVVEKILFEGIINEEDSLQLKNEIKGILNVPEIAKLFNESYKIFAERELLMPDGEVFRPDRVLIKNNAAIVIDFKTGRREKKHIDQIIGYARILHSIGYEEVESKIVYLTDRSVLDISN